MQLDAMIAKARATNRANEAKRAELEATIADAKAEIEQLNSIGHVQMVRAIADGIQREMPDRRVEVLGPFGLGAETAIHVIDNDDIVASIDFRPDQENRPGLVRLTHEADNTFAPRTLGAMSGLNRKSVPLTGTIADLVSELRKQDKERA